MTNWCARGLILPSPPAHVPFLRSRLHLQPTFPSVGVSFRDISGGAGRQQESLTGQHSGSRHRDALYLPKTQPKHKYIKVNAGHLRLGEVSSSRCITRPFFSSYPSIDIISYLVKPSHSPLIITIGHGATFALFISISVRSH